ncbi:hypothetical protein [Chelativorans salis]|uniref:DUF3426 domain-containing protein n=1 Tax=Chelativorans salis TaxID=2978478 RepID=A0ABT2LS22_9HYPH|nr:hypothetical protein [Chelativorans sp. EGI FJ00035]MCT7377335.1 hypothetical protein [Chelativorans sp. EGI FJ00035]
MPEKRSRAPVSGEIIVEGEPAAGGPGPLDAVSSPFVDIVEAEYETLAPRPAAGAASAMVATVPPTGLDMLRRGAYHTSERRLSLGSSAFCAFVLLAVAGAFWVSGGHAALDHVSPMWAQSSASALRIVELESRIESTGGSALLLIDGEAVNEGGATERLPDLSVNVLDMEGHTTHYFLGTSGKQLAAGDRFAFSSRLAAPKDGVKSVSVTFRE